MMAVVLALVVVAILFKLAIRLILFPLFLFKWLVTGMVMMVLVPVFLIVGLVMTFVFALLFAIPLLPLLVLGAIVWFLVSASRRPAVA